MIGGFFMKKEDEIMISLDSLCIYKGMFKEGVGAKFSTLVESLYSYNSIEDCISKYNDFVYELFSEYNNLSFKEYVVEGIIESVNPFNTSIEKAGGVEDFILTGVNNELESLNYISNVNSLWIKDILISKCVDNEILCKKINNLLDWGIRKFSCEVLGKDDYGTIKKLFVQKEEWTDLIDRLVDFHNNNGTGKFAKYKAFVWENFNGENGHLRGISEPDPIKLSQLIGYASQKEEIIKNTEHFLNGSPANNLLLYGSRGTGKSSTVKAILNHYYEEGLRLIEVDKEQLVDFTRIIRLLKDKKQKFIIFVDDLVFDENEGSYSALKTIIEGRIENRPSNILIYATTNRRHLVQEKFTDRDDVHSKDTMEEKLSLADRFGITISFFTPDQKEFLKIVDGIVRNRGMEIDEQYLHREALKWEKWHNGKSPRSATQFIDWLEGEERLKK